MSKLAGWVPWEFLFWLTLVASVLRMVIGPFTDGIDPFLAFLICASVLELRKEGAE